MNPFLLILREIAYRKLGFLAALLAVTVAVGLAVALAVVQSGIERETRRNMLAMGFNVRIVPQGTEAGQLFFDGHANATMPEDTIQRMAAAPKLSYNHLVASLSWRVEVEGVDAILCGIAPQPPAGGKKPMIKPVPAGKVVVGHAVATALELEPGGALTIRERTLTVGKVLSESGSVDDVTIYGDLADVQSVLDLPQQINEIKAMDCLCQTADENPLEALRTELETLLPEAEVVHLSAIADARARQRQVVEGTARFLVPVTMLGVAAWICLLAALNVRERRSEIGILRALGRGGATIATLFLGRAALLGVLGALLGFALGTWGALSFGAETFELTARALRFDGTLFVQALALAPLGAMLASLVPTMAAITQDPATTLRQE